MIQSLTNLTNFLNKYRCTDEEPSHLAYGNFNGKFKLDTTQRKEFMNLYFKAIINDHELGILEKSKEYGPLLIDIDLELPTEEWKTNTRLYNDDLILAIMSLYTNELNNYIEDDKNKNYYFYIFEKDKPTDKNGYIKDGFHLVVPNVCLSYDDKFYLRNQVIKQADKDELFCGFMNTAEKIIDKAVIKSNGWFLYGSTKPGYKPYKITKILSYDFNNKNYNDITEDLNNHELKDIIGHLSIQSSRFKKSKRTECKEIKQEEKPTQKKEDKQISQDLVSDKRKLIKFLIDILNNDRAKDYETWRNVVFIINNELGKEGIDLAIEFSKKCLAKFNEKKIYDFYYNIKKNESGLKLPTLKAYAKEDNPEEYIKLFKSNDIIINDDTEGAKYIIEQLNNKIIKCHDIIYMCDRVFIKLYDNANIYLEDKTMHFKRTYNYLLKLILELPIKKMDARGNVKPYSQNMSGAKQLAETTFTLLKEDNEFIDKTWHSNIGKLCFLNGYYNFKTKQFKPYDANTYTTVWVNMDFPTNINETYEKKLKDDVLNKILYNDKVQKNFLNWCSRGLAGEYTEKTWSIGLGFRNSGKSVITDLFSEAFNNYVGTFNAEELLCTRIGNGDISKKLSWLIPFQFRRLNFSNELKTCDDNGRKLKMDGNQIKSVSSGGDKKTARSNYKDPFEFKIQGRMCLFMNDILETDPKDATETLQVFEFMSIFKSELTDENIKVNEDKECETKYFLKDDKIKELIKDEEIKKAFIKIIIDNYSNEPIYSTNTSDFVASDNNLVIELKDLYDFTLNKQDKMTVEEVNNINKDNLNPNYTKAKIKQTLSSMGICQQVITENKKSTRYYTGLKLKKID